MLSVRACFFKKGPIIVKTSVIRRLGAELCALFWILLTALFPMAALAGFGPQGFTFQGRFFQPDGITPLTGNVTLLLSLYSPDGTCLLYQESLPAIDLTSSSGLFAVNVGSVTADPIRTGIDPGIPMAVLLANSGTQIRAAGAHCTAGYTPIAGDGRQLEVTYTPLGGSPTTLTPNIVINSVPFATVAETLQGKTPSEVAALSLGTALTGLNTSLTGSIAATDSVLTALGKLQNSVSNAVSSSSVTVATTSVSAAPGLTGSLLSVGGSTLTDNATAASGTAGNEAFTSIAQPTLAATQTNVSTTNAFSMYIAGAPAKGSNDTATNAIALGIGGGSVTGQVNSYGVYVTAQSGATNNYAAAFLSGNVGIGTAVPAAPLSVAGAVQVGTSALGCDGTTQGSIRYNNGTSALEYCNGSAWGLVQASACSTTTPAPFSFTNQANATVSTVTMSDIIQLTGFNCNLTTTISGTGSPSYRICQDSACSTVVQGWTTGPSSITSGQYIQTKLTTGGTGGVANHATLLVGNGATMWGVTTTGSCASSPAIGTVCADGSVYAGLSPDGGVPMYAQRCDLGQSWNGVACTGTRATPSYNNGSVNYLASGTGNADTGKANTATLVALTDAGAPYQAATNCAILNEDGHTDWYLPAKDELAVLSSSSAVIGNFSTGTYLASTEGTNPSDVWVVSFNNGSEYNVHKNDVLFGVRCVRR